MAQEYIILAINPGSTSTKIALFDGTEPFATASIDHTPPDGGIWDEFESRLAQIRAKFEEIRENRVSPQEIFSNLTNEFCNTQQTLKPFSFFLG